MAGSYLKPTAEIFSEGSWKAIEPGMPFGVMDHCMLLMNSTTAMVIGGTQNTKYSNRTYFYHFNANTWIRGPDLITGRSYHACGMVKKNKNSDEVSFTQFSVEG